MPGFDFNPNDLHQLHRLVFVPRGVVADDTSGGHRTRRRGGGADFLDYRPYVPGDDLRSVDWTLYGRFRQLYVRQFESPQQISVTILLDSSRSMGFGSPLSKLLQAQRLTCGLGFIAMQSGERLFALAYGREAAPFLGPVTGPRGLPALVRFLQKIEPAGRSDLAAAVRQMHARGRRKGLTVVISDFLDGLDPEEPLSRILAAGGQAMVVQINDDLDRGIGLKGTVRLTDSETGRRVDVRIDPGSLARYQRLFEERRQQIENFCIRRGQTYLRVSTADNYLERVCEVLRSRTMAR